MDLTILIMILGVILIIMSFFIKSPVKRIEKELEGLSLDYYQDANQFKRRMKIIEEELMIDPNLINKTNKTYSKPIHEILVNQVLALHQQGYSVDEISKRSALTIDQVKSVIGGRK
ncbi:MAG: hypothetical protein ACE3JQ_08050 [Paenisporosarcina sp.]